MKKSKKSLKKNKEIRVPIIALLGFCVFILITMISLFSSSDNDVPDYMMTKEKSDDVEPYSIAVKEQPTSGGGGGVPQEDSVVRLIEALTSRGYMTFILLIGGAIFLATIFGFMRRAW